MIRTCVVCQAKHKAKTVKCPVCRIALKPKVRRNESSHAGYLVKQDGPVFALLYRDPDALDPTPQAVAFYSREADCEAAARAMTEAMPGRGNGHGGVRKKKAA